MVMGQVLVRGLGSHGTGGVVWMAMLASLLLTACGETDRNGGLGASGNVATGGAAVAAAGASMTAGASAAGAAGSPVDVAPPIDISGRWAMFHFEDPVGVNLSESVTGNLGGRGCVAGAPYGDAQDDAAFNLCGDVFGSVMGNRASFGFPIGPGVPAGYSAEVTISKDAQRMTGSLHTGTGDGIQSMSWLRVPAEQPWLVRAPSASDQVQPLDGSYEAHLVSSAGGDGSEYLTTEMYAVHYSRRTLSGSLGSFWFSEMSDPAFGSPLRVGPVSATAPELPTSMRLEFDAQGFTEASVTTASGHDYAFVLRRTDG